MVHLPPQQAENVQVVIRMRPKAASERGQPSLVSIAGETAVTVDPLPSTLEKMGIQNKASLSRTFTYDKAYDSSTSQELLFNESVAPVVDEVLRGFSCTVFCYGQTGTGKTYTMEGPKRADGGVETEGPDAGIIPRAIKRIFGTLPPEGEGCDWVVKVSFLEIYNEKLDDLLSADPSSFQSEGGFQGGLGGGGPRTGALGITAGAGGASSSAASSSSSSSSSSSAALKPGEEKLKLVNDEKAGVRVAGLEEIQVSSPRDCFEHLARSIAKRATAETKCNAASSRSHCVFTVTITMKESFDGEDTLRVGKLNLVDLAGSECVGRSGATDKRAREAGNINQSLLTLGRVITALVEGMPHVPYRDSKLTRLLQDSLGGRTKTCMIATVSPATGNMEETLSTLECACNVGEETMCPPPP
jgi:kinesin family protein 11